MEIVEVRAEPLVLPLRAPFQVSRRTAHEAPTVHVLVVASDSSQGEGSATPVAYVTGESVETVTGAIQQAAPEFLGRSLERLSPLLYVAGAALAGAPSARAAVEMAVLDLWAKRWNLPLWHYFGAAEDRLVTDLTIPIVDPSEARELAKKAAADGFRHVKIKVGSPEGPEADLARVAAILEGAPGIGLRIDANQAFDPEGAVRFVLAVQRQTQSLEMVEQPVPQHDIAGLALVKSRVGVPVFADESAQTVGDVRRLLAQDAIDGVNIKLMKSGIAGAWQIANLCRAWGKKTMIGCMLESRLGLAASCLFAAGIGGFDFIDLDAHLLLAPDSALTGGFREEGDTLLVESRRPGWGITRMGS